MDAGVALPLDAVATYRQAGVASTSSDSNLHAPDGSPAFSDSARHTEPGPGPREC